MRALFTMPPDVRDGSKGDIAQAFGRIRSSPEPGRRAFATAELSDELVQAISASRMDERHAHLDAMLEPKWRS